MKIFGSVVTSAVTGKKENNKIIGRLIANKEWLFNLLKLDPFDRYDFFYENNKDLLIEEIKEIIPLNIQSKINYFPLTKLTSAFSQTEYYVFHHFDPIIGYLAKIRDLYAKSFFPIIGITHTISTLSIHEGCYVNINPSISSNDSIVCTSNAGKKAFSKILNSNESIFKGRLDIIPLAIEPKDYENLDKEKSRRKLNLSPDDKIILSLGRLSIYDKMDLSPFFDVLENLFKEFENLKWVIAGSARYPDTLNLYKDFAAAKNLNDRIIFHTNFDDAFKLDLLAASDIFFSPSDNLQETFGVSILEAMAAGLPVIASDWSGYKDIILNEKTGFLIPTLWANCCSHLNAISAFVHANQLHLDLAQSTAIDVHKTYLLLKKLIESSELRKNFGTCGKERVEKHFSWKNSFEKYLTLIKDLRKNRPLEGQINNKLGRDIDFFKSFSHYCTKILKADDKVKVTLKAENLLKNKANFPVFLPLSPVIENTTLIQKILFLSRKEIDVNQLIKKLARLSDDNNELIFYLILHLIKHGYLKLKE